MKLNLSKKMEKLTCEERFKDGQADFMLESLE